MLLKYSSSRPSFLSTLPVRGATQQPAEWDQQHPISIHAPREGSDSYAAYVELGTGISIHAPREGSDGVTLFCKTHGDISIHAPREGSDGISGESKGESKHFYPRSP